MCVIAFQGIEEQFAPFLKTNSSSQTFQIVINICVVHECDGDPNTCILSLSFSTIFSSVDIFFLE